MADGGRGLKRSLSAPTLQDPALHAVLLDCLGNAGDPSSLRTLVDHMTGDVAMVTGSGELSVRHAAVKAVARQKTVEVCVCVYQRICFALHKEFWSKNALL